MQNPFIPKRGRISNGFKFCACFSVTLIFLWALALIVLLYLVHMQIVFLNPPLVVQPGIQYYNKPVPGPVDGTRAEVGSFNWFVYATDLLLMLPVIVVPVLFMIDLLFSAGISAIGSIITFVLFALLQLAKSVYISLIWLGWFGLSCETQPFCVSRSPAGAASTPDSTFVLEAIFTYAFALFSILLAIILPRVFRTGERDRAAFMSSREKLDFSRDAEASETVFGDMIVGSELPASQRRSKKSKLPTGAVVKSVVTSVAAPATTQRQTPSIF